MLQQRQLGSSPEHGSMSWIFTCFHCKLILERVSPGTARSFGCQEGGEDALWAWWSGGARAVVPFLTP